MNGQCLSEEVSEIVSTFAPSDKKIVLLDTITDPMELHVDGLRLLRSDSVGRQTDSTHVITENFSSWLGVSDVGENVTECDTFFGIDEESSLFCLRDGSNNNGNDRAECKTGTVDFSWIFVAKIKNTPGDRAGVRAGKIRGIGLNKETHFTCGKDKSIVGVPSTILE